MSEISVNFSRRFLEIRKLVDKRIRHESHAAYLETCLDARIAPRGLQIVFPPSTTNLSESDLKKWNTVLTNASLDLVKIVKNHCQATSTNVKRLEGNLLRDNELSPHENAALKSFEEKKRGIVGGVKESKLARDNVKYSPTTESGRGIENNSLDRTNIVNLSSVELTHDEESLLSRGLNFCPTTGQYDDFTLLQDLDNFARSLRLQEFFFEKPQQSASPLPSTSSGWTPSPNRDKHLDLYIQAVQKDIVSAYKKKQPHHDNLSLAERKALKDLGNRKDIIIKPADKGGAIVVLNSSDYIQEGYRQLNDTKFYRHLNSDPISQHAAFIHERLSQLEQKGEITINTLRGLTAKHAVPGRFYMLPKIHKEGNPGRPIISGSGTLTEPISSFVDNLIRHIPPTFPSYIRDTTHFLREISKIKIPKDAYLVTMDVSALYTNIPHKDGIEALVRVYEAHKRDDSPEGHVLAALSSLVLELNSFEFDGKFFLQTSGTAMGTKMAPNFANIFMGDLESTFLASCPLQPLFYKRYIDDVFFIWSYAEHELLKFIADFNSAHPSIRFTHSYSKTDINFLDVSVIIKDTTLVTQLYRKPTDSQQYLHFDSCHPRPCRTGIPYSQAHRFKRICSNNDDFDSNTNQLCEVLKEQKYPEKIINDAISKARALDRGLLLEDSGPQAETSRQANLVLTFSNKSPNVTAILRKHFNILQQSERLAKIITTVPRVVYRRSRNIKDSIVRSKTTVAESTGSRPCGKARCGVCQHVAPRNSVESTNSDFTYKIYGNLNCDTSNLVYLLKCSTCGMQYVGQTETPFRLRFNNHRAHVKSIPQLPLSKHVSMPGHSFDKLEVTFLQSGFRSNRDREQKESYLIHKFNTIKAGINEHPGIMSSIHAVDISDPLVLA